MGKSPAKWIKTLLLGKKSSKSSFSKGKEKLNSANKGGVLVSSKVTVSDLSVDSPSISAPILLSRARNVVDSEKGIPAQLPIDGANIPSLKVDGNNATTGNFGNPENPDRIRLDPAAVTVQAAFRGYLIATLPLKVTFILKGHPCFIDDNIMCWKARRAFRILKGIIRLQAVIRGHLVRRQAVATLCCTWGIVKLQALARGQKVRCSDIAMEIQEKHLRLLQGLKSSNSIGVSISSTVKNLSSNVFVQKLLASSPSVLPLQLQYVQRWTRSKFWEYPSKPIRSGKTKLSVQKLSFAEAVNGSSHSTLEYEKNKRGLRRVSVNSAADSVQEHPQNELERVKRNLRKLSNSSKEVTDKSEFVNEKTKKTLKKYSSSNDPDVLEQESAEKIRDVTATLSELSILEADLKFSSEHASLGEPIVCPAVNFPPAKNNGKIEHMPVTEELNSKDEQVGDESSNTNQRRASFPAKIDNQANGLNHMPKVPNFMAPTESAKARLRGQGSPRFIPEAVEKNGLNRRYSLPTSTNSNTGSQSLHTQRQVRVAGKGAIISDKSQSSSKDANDKVVRAEWRR